jgi:antitoxin CptB
MNINIQDLKKKIIYRSSYRGSKEMDSLLGSFSKKYVNILNEEDLVCLSKLIDIDDENLYKYNQGLKTTVKINENKVTKLFRDFVYKKI